MRCDNCKKDFPENLIHEHHIHPRFMDNPKGDGMKIPLCKKCHDILHKIIPTIIWKFVPLIYKQQCIDAVIDFTNKYIKKDDGNM